MAPCRMKQRRGTYNEQIPALCALDGGLWAVRHFNSTALLAIYQVMHDAGTEKTKFNI